VDHVRGRRTTARSSAGPYRRANRGGREDSLDRKRTSGRLRPEPLTREVLSYPAGKKNDYTMKQVEVDGISVRQAETCKRPRAGTYDVAVSEMRRADDIPVVSLYSSKSASIPLVVPESKCSDRASLPEVYLIRSAQ
jgi:hypothetical protein